MKKTIYLYKDIDHEAESAVNAILKGIKYNEKMVALKSEELDAFINRVTVVTIEVPN